MTNKKKLFSAAVMLLIAAVAVTSASYAWFTMNKEVSTTGLTMTATAPTSLQISVNGGDYGVTASLATTVKPFTPVSGEYLTPELFYALTMNTDGALVSEIGDSVFTDVVAAADASRQYYVDIPVAIKSLELEAATNVELYIKSLEITGTIGNAFKVAVINGDDLMGIYANDGTNGWYPLEDATTIAEEATEPTAQGVTGGTVVGTITAADTPVNLVLRVWLEGQDEDCIYANASGNYGVTVVFEGIDVLAS